MAAIGALMGTSFVFYSFIYTALIGGIIGLLIIFKSRGFINTIKSFFFNVTHIVFFRSNLGSIIIPRDRASSITFPYGVAIVLGTLCTLYLGWILMKSEKGQSLVEFALVIPLLILLLFGIVDFGRIFHAYLTLIMQVERLHVQQVLVKMIHK